MQENGRLYHQVQAPVAIGLGVFDVVLPLKEDDIVLAQKGLCQHIDIRREGADYPNPGNVVDVLLNACHADGKLFPLQLFQRTLRGFQPGLDGFNGVSVILEGQFLVQHMEFSGDLHHGAAVIGHQLPVGMSKILYLVSDLVLGQLFQHHALQLGIILCFTFFHGFFLPYNVLTSLYTKSLCFCKELINKSPGHLTG